MVELNNHIALQRRYYGVIPCHLAFHGRAHLSLCSEQRLGEALYKFQVLEFNTAIHSAIQQRISFISLLLINIFIYLSIHKPPFSHKTIHKKYPHITLQYAQLQLNYLLKYKSLLPTFNLRTNSINSIQVNINICHEVPMGLNLK